MEIEATPDPAVRLVSRNVRRLTLFIAGLAFVVGPLLLLFPARTDTLFAWTIQPPLTAAFLGAGYTMALVVEILAYRERVWARSRVFFSAILPFTTLTLLATLLHLDRFHFNSPGLAARGTAWAWFLIYVIAPPVMAALLLLQLRVPGGDPPRRAPLPPAFRTVIGTQAALMLGVGALLFLAPGTANTFWPWNLTPLTAQAVAAWLLGLGLALAHATWENDWERIRLALAGAVVAGSLQLLVLLGLAGSTALVVPNAWVYGLFLVSLLVSGVGGLLLARQRMPQPVALAGN
jgi:hypothetical protein